MYSAVISNSETVHLPNRLIVGKGGWAKLMTKRLDSFNQTTVGEYIKRVLNLDIQVWERCNTAGASSKERILLGEFNDENAQVILPQDFEQFPPQPKNMAFVINCHLRFGGVSVRYPKAFTYMDGTQP
jgi:hypothetical protein